MTDYRRTLLAIAAVWVVTCIAIVAIALATLDASC